MALTLANHKLAMATLALAAGAVFITCVGSGARMIGPQGVRAWVGVADQLWCWWWAQHQLPRRER